MYQILVETAQFVISNRRESSIKEIINFLKNLKDAIDQNLSENTFEDQSENESQIMKLEMDASLFLNISCYYQKYLNESKMSELYIKKSM